MERILITGGAGFLGSYLCEKLLKKGHNVIALDMSDGSKEEHLMDNKDFQFIQGSVLDRDLMQREVKKADIVFHFAAIADPKRYVQEPLTVLEIDLQATLNILKLAAQDKTKVIFASTSEIYGRNPKTPWAEDDDRVLGSTAINRWCYSSSKATSEHYLYAYHQHEGLPFATVRFFNVYGPKLDDLGSGRVIPIFLKQFLMNEPVTIHGDGSHTRTYVYVEDAVDAVLKVAFCKKAEQQAFNIGRTEEVSVLELAKLLKKVGNFKSEFKFIPHKEVFGDKYEDIPRRIPKIDKIKKYCNWTPSTSLEDGLKKTIEYYKKKII